MLPNFKQANCDCEHFKAIVNSSDLPYGIENEVSLNDDEAYEFVQSLWLEIISTTEKNKDRLFTFIEYLDLMKSKAKRFSYWLVLGGIW